MNKLTRVAVFVVGTFVCASSVFAAATDDDTNTAVKPTPTLTTTSTTGSGGSGSSYKSGSQYDSDSGNSGFYLGAKLGVSLERLKESFPNIKQKMNSKTKNAPNAALTLGYDFNDQYQVPIRTEFDYTFRKGVDIKEHKNNFNARSNVRLETAMLNAYYDIYTDTPFTPYLGAGLGYANLKLETRVQGDKRSANHNKFAWTVGAGVGYKVNEHVNLLLGYQFLQTGEIKTDVSKIKASSHDIFAGVNYYF